MTQHPAETIYPDNAVKQHGLARSYHRKILVGSSEAEIQAMDLPYCVEILFDGRVFTYNAGSSASHDGTTTLVSNDGRRYIAQPAGGDMLSSTYDPTNVNADAFNADNHVSGSANKVYEATDKTKVDFLSVTGTADLDQMQLDISALDSAVVLQGSWDASVGTFAGGGTAQTGHSYIVNVEGTVDGESFKVNDRIVAIVDDASINSYASNWLKLDYTDQVLSVAGKAGAVTLDADDVFETASKKWAAETGADVTDESNVVSALDGAAIATATVAASDKVLIQDSDGSDALKTVTAQAIADLSAGGGGGGGFTAPDIIIFDEKASGTNAGTFTSGAWRTRDMNTIERNIGTIASLSSNQITLDAGDYYFQIQAPAYQVTRHLAKLVNTTTTTDLLIGRAAYTSNTVQTDSTIEGVVTLAAGQALEIQHRSSGTKATFGFGVGAGFGEVERYTVLKAWKL